MRHLDIVDDRFECALESIEAPTGVLCLPGLVIFPAEDDEIVVAVRFEAQIVVRIGGVPEQRVRHASLCDASADDVARVERKLGLKQHRRHETGRSSQRRMRGEHDRSARNRVAVCVDRERRVAEFLGGGVLEDHAAAIGDRLRHSGKIAPRVEPGLIKKHHARAANERYVGDELGVETEPFSERCFVLERADRIRRACVHRPALSELALRPAQGERVEGMVEVAGHPREVAVDRFLADDGVDLRNRCEARIPHSLCVIAADAPDQIRQLHVGDHRQMRRGVAGVDFRASLALEQRHAAAGERQEVRGCEAGNAAADHRDVDRLVAVQLWEPWYLCRFKPIRLRVEIGLHIFLPS